MHFLCTCKYDAWGKFLGAYNSSGSKITNTNDIALINPLRYRGYYYDTETGFYYLGSRYYDPQMYRFLNADSLLLFGNDLKGINLFSYCDDNPINYFDYNGNIAICHFNTIVCDAGGGYGGGGGLISLAILSA